MGALDKVSYGIEVSDYVINKFRDLSQNLTAGRRGDYKNGFQSELSTIQTITSDNFLQVGASRVIPIPDEELNMLHYKKDDWDVWATPMLTSVLSSLAMLEKMHLADVSALDGAITQIRLWKLGDIEAGIFPGPAAFTKLSNMLDNCGTGVLDLIWGPDLDFKESSTSVHQFLGSEKYKQVMSEIHTGLGISQSLSGGGGSSSGGGFTNNAISIKVLVERLEYVRGLLQDFWESELKDIQKAMGWKTPGHVVFDFAALSDEATVKKMLTDLWDRNVISTESLRETFGKDNDIENVRIRGEERQRKNNKIPHKAGPFTNGNPRITALQSILANGGIISPKLLEMLDIEGEEIIEDIKSEKERVEKQKVQEMAEKAKGIPGQGRPLNSTDKTKRKQKDVKVRKLDRATASSDNFIKNLFWAKSAQKQIDGIIQEGFLNVVGKNNLRQLTKTEVTDYEMLKFKVLSNLPSDIIITNKSVADILEHKKTDELCKTLYIGLENKFKQLNERNPNIEEMREIQCSSYALSKTGDENGDD
jgi:hypothetical protein